MSQFSFVLKGGVILAQVLNEYLSHVVVMCIFRTTQLLNFFIFYRPEASISGFKLGQLCGKWD